MVQLLLKAVPVSQSHTKTLLGKLHVRVESLPRFIIVKSSTSCSPALPFLLSIPVMLTHPFSCIKLMFIRAFTELNQLIHPGAHNSLFCHVSFLPGQWVESISLGAWGALDLLLARASVQPGAGKRSKKIRTGHQVSPVRKETWPAVICLFTSSNLTLTEKGFFAAKEWNSPLQISAVCHKPVLQANKDPDNQQVDSEPNQIPYGKPGQKVSLMYSWQLPLGEKCMLQLSVFPYH